MAGRRLHARIVRTGAVSIIQSWGFMVVFGVTMPLWAGSSPCQADAVYGAEKSKVYHTHADCPSGRKIKPENRVGFQSVKDAENQGRRLCRFCQRLDEKEAQEAEAEKATPARDDAPAASPRPSALVGEPPAVAPTEQEQMRPPPNLPTRGRVRQVTPDGTLELDGGEKVRLLGVCWPRPGQSGAKNVHAWLRSRTENEEVRLSYDPGRAQCQYRDAMGRVWAYVQLESESSDLGSSLLEEGLGWLDRETPCERNAAYNHIEDDACWHGKGIWKRLDGEAGNRPVVIGRYSHLYYPVDSIWVASLVDPTTITLNEAKSRRLAPAPDQGIIRKKKESKGRKEPRAKKGERGSDRAEQRSDWGTAF